MNQKKDTKPLQLRTTSRLILFLSGFVELAGGLAILLAWCFRAMFPSALLHVEPDFIIGLIFVHGGILLVSVVFIFEKFDGLKPKGG